MSYPFDCGFKDGVTTWLFEVNEKYIFIWMKLPLIKIIKKKKHFLLTYLQSGGKLKSKNGKFNNLVWNPKSKLEC